MKSPGLKDPAVMDPVVAAADVVGRSGAEHFEIGWLYDEEDPPPDWPPGKPVPVEAQGWYATATYKGAKLTGEGAGPVQAAEALARRVLRGGRCTHCDRVIHLNDGFDPPPGVCLWRRRGKRWEGCWGSYGTGKARRAR